jgi:hypothetical protein
VIFRSPDRILTVTLHLTTAEWEMTAAAAQTPIGDQANKVAGPITNGHVGAPALGGATGAVSQTADRASPQG